VRFREIYADFEDGDLTGEKAIRAFELLDEHAMISAGKARIAIEENRPRKGLTKSNCSCNHGKRT
jgi:hypothetical protein